MIILFAIPAFILLIVIELLVYRKQGPKTQGRGYEWRDTVASLTMGVGSLVTKAPLLGLIFLKNSFLFEHRFFDLPNAWWIWPVLIVCEDLCYYWFHRLHHEIRFLWAGHVSHHSSEHYNLSTALRQPWTTIITGMIFWSPLPLLGFDPKMIIVAQSISLLYQYWIHTELVGTLGPLEWIFNTPSHHRVHHGRNPIYLDRNHGGILIIWDRLFGSFEQESKPVDYGLTTNIKSFNIATIFLHEFIAIWHDVRNVKSLRHKLGYLFAAPGWSHDGSRKTSKEMRAETLADSA